MRRWLLPLFIAGIIFLASVLPALAPRRQEPQAALATPAPALHPEATGKPDRTGYVKGIYIAYAAMGNDELTRHTQSLLEDTELNAVVLDFKSDRGLLSFPSQVPLAIEIGAAQAPVVRDPATYLNWFKQRSIYTIARIVTFKDTTLAHGRPGLAIINAATGQVWRDQEGMGWVDPFRREAWDYNTALALEAAALGFDEVQFDYIRFPTDGNVASARYSQPNNQANRTAAIAGFLDQVRRAIAPYNTRISIDVFGYTAWVPDDLGIGQQIEVLAPHVDVLAPMLYPSTFNAGLPGESAKYRNAIAYPYEIVHKSTLRTITRAQAVNPAIQVRPWIQDFKDYAFDGRRYTPTQIRSQMEGARAAGGRGWMLWDPAVRYTRQALVSASPGYMPNPDGKVLIVSYRDFASAPDANGTSPEQLRADLDKLLANGFYPINLRELTEEKLRSVPAGKRPVAITFDGATLDQFRLQADGGVDPNCAVGVLLAMNAAHPADWPLRATFFVQPHPDPARSAVFGTHELASVKLQLLTSWGMEVGIQLPASEGASTTGDGSLRTMLREAFEQLAVWLPGYAVTTVAWATENTAATGLRQLLGEALDTDARRITGAVLPGGGLAFAPNAPAFDPYRLARVPSRELDAWVAQATRFGVHYVSGGE
ncbi:MAG: hypothetical protein N2204_00665 [Anaerolineae bacterium]|nr:hypothetical protein [Anaerolineae bacterium]